MMFTFAAHHRPFLNQERLQRYLLAGTASAVPRLPSEPQLAARITATASIHIRLAAEPEVAFASRARPEHEDLRR